MVGRAAELVAPAIASAEVLASRGKAITGQLELENQLAHIGAALVVEVRLLQAGLTQSLRMVLAALVGQVALIRSLVRR